MRKREWLGLIVAGALLVGCGDEGARGVERYARLVVADGEDGTLRLFDLHEGGLIATFETGAPVSLSAGDRRRFGYAISSSGGFVRVIDSGLVYVDHGDHGHVGEQAPALLDFALTGTRPVHFTHFEGQAVFFFDGALGDEIAPARVVVLPEISLSQGNPQAQIVDFTLDVPQHGVAVPVGDGLLVSADVPEPEGDGAPLPSGVVATSWEGDVEETFGALCPALHGEAMLDEHRVAFACASHILVVEREARDAEWGTRTIAYPDTRRAGTLAASEDGRYLFGNHQAEGDVDLLRVDVETGEVDLLPLEASLASFLVVPGHEALVALLTTDGVLSLVDVETLEVVARFSAVAPFVASYSAPTPKLAVTTETVFVSDTEGGRVLEYDTEALAPGRRFRVGGRPSSIVVLGPGLAIEDEHHH